MTNHKYADWELFGKFICHAVENYIDEIDEFVREWSYGEYDVLDKEWPEWVDFVKENT